MTATSLSQRRKAAGYTQQAFADALGVSRITVSYWETGRAQPNAVNARKVGDLLGVRDIYETLPKVTVTV